MASWQRFPLAATSTPGKRFAQRILSQTEQHCPALKPAGRGSDIIRSAKGLDDAIDPRNFRLAFAVGDALRSQAGKVRFDVFRRVRFEIRQTLEAYVAGRRDAMKTGAAKAIGAKP